MTIKENMNTYKKTAVSVGVLYIAATVAGVLSVGPATSLLNAVYLKSQVNVQLPK